MTDEERLEETAAPVNRECNGRWAKGASGNPAGRPLGSRNNASRFCDDILEENAEELTNVAVQLALQGDAAALRLCLERVVPKRRHRPLQLNWPPIRTLEDVSSAVTATLAALAAGELEIDQGTALIGILDGKRRAIEAVELEQRIAMLEAQPADPLDATIAHYTAQMKELTQ